MDSEVNKQLKTKVGEVLRNKPLAHLAEGSTRLAWRLVVVTLDKLFTAGCCYVRQ